MLIAIVFFWGVILMSMCEANTTMQPHTGEYLSDIYPYHISFVQGWGELGIDVAAHAPGQTPLPLRIKDKGYTKGLGHHAPGEIVVELDGLYVSFEAEVGVQWQTGENVGSVVFQVFVDGEKRFDSGVVREHDPPRRVSISVAGAQELRLVVTDASDGITCDCANWADARLIQANPPKLQPAREEPLDMAWFARVVSWDPNRTDGCRCSRVEEFPAEDVFLESDVLPDVDGTYTVPVARNGLGCIGLQWVERRRIKELAMEFADGTPKPSPDGVQVQGWFGESPWQGNWKPLKGTIKHQKQRWLFQVDWQQNPEVAPYGVEKIRWVFPPSAQPIVVRRLSAFTDSRWDTVELVISLEKPMMGKVGDIEVYNGTIVAPSGSGSPLRCSWDLKGALQLRLRYSKSKTEKSDRTIIFFKLPTGAFGVAVEDVLAHKYLYVRDLGIFIACAPTKLTIAEYRKKIARRRTVLEQVRKMPDQTFEQALEKVHHAIQDNGPTMLSLACDNHKFVVQREGTVRYENFELIPQLGSGKNEGLKRQLHGGWLPVPVTTVQEDGIVYSQRTFVVPYDKADARTWQEPRWFNRQPLCVVEFSIENSSPYAANAVLRLNFLADADRQAPAQIQQLPQAAVVQSEGRLLASVNTKEATSLRVKVQDAVLILSGVMPAEAREHCYVYIPAWEMKVEQHGLLRGEEGLLSEVEAYWERVLADAMQIEIPEPLLHNLIRASQVHCLTAARNEQEGQRIAPWIASMVYGPLESEAHSIIRGMDLMGHHEFARRGLEFFIHHYSPAGFLTTGYTLVGTGWHLWTLGEHYLLTQEREWLNQVAPQVARVCRWIAQQREKTKRLDAHGKKFPEYGLMPPGVAADWNRFAYRFFVQGHYNAGLRMAARMLKDIGYHEADPLLENAAEFDKEILRAYRWVQSHAPVLPLSDGTWVPAYPGMLYCFGLIGEMFPGEDGGRSWAYDVEIGAHHLVPLGVLEPNSQDALWITEHMEDFWFLHSGMGDYPEDENRKDWFNLGGFSKLQPYYTRIAEIYALRDEVKPYIRSYFNAIPSLLNTENLSLWEHFHNRGAWNKTHETGWFLQQTRFMFVMERGDELWLAPFVTTNWLKDGMVVAVRDAPTRFGKVSYQITSCVQHGFIEAVIKPPTRRLPQKVVIRLRHPQGKPMRTVTVNGRRHKEFDAAKECIRIKPIAGTIRVRAQY